MLCSSGWVSWEWDCPKNSVSKPALQESACSSQILCVRGQLSAVVELQTTGAHLLTNALPAKELLDILMVKGTRRKQTQLLSSLWGELQANPWWIGLAWKEIPRAKISQVLQWGICHVESLHTEQECTASKSISVLAPWRTRWPQISPISCSSNSKRFSS